MSSRYGDTALRTVLPCEAFRKHKSPTEFVMVERANAVGAKSLYERANAVRRTENE